MSADRIIMGLDTAGTTGVAEGIPGGVPTLYSRRFRLEDDNSPVEAFGRAVVWGAKRFAEIKPAAVFIEATIPDTALHGETTHGAQMIKMGLYAILTGIARAKGIPVYPVNINKYRKAFTGHGGLRGDEGKKLVMQQCRERGWDPPDLDSSDAAGVWWYGCTQSDALYQMHMKF